MHKAPADPKPKRQELMARFGPSSGVGAGRGGLGARMAQRADGVASSPEMQAIQPTLALPVQATTDPSTARTMMPSRPRRRRALPRL